jgi:tetratricopeptide (TPR) repeat protein
MVSATSLAKSSFDTLPDFMRTTSHEALQIKEGLLKPDDPSLATTLSNLAGVHWKRREFDKAEPLFRRAAEIMKTAHGAESHEYGVLLSNLGALYSAWADEPSQEARRAQAIDYSTRALALKRKAQGERHPETATSYNNFARMNAKLSDWSAGADGVARAVAIMLSLDLAQHPNTQSMARDLALFWERGPARRTRRRGCAAATFPISYR